MMEEAIAALGWAILAWFVWLIVQAGPVEAQEYTTARVSWEAPTERVNGDPLPAEELMFFLIYVNPHPVYEGENDVYEVSPERTTYDIQVIAEQCSEIYMYSAATGSPACKPEQQYMLSDPSVSITHCPGLSNNPNPPEEFEQAEYVEQS